MSAAQVNVIVHARKNRETGTLILVERTGPGSWLEDEPGWMTLCDEHSSCCMHSTRALAIHHAAVPSTWCGDCRRIREAELR